MRRFYLSFESEDTKKLLSGFDTLKRSVNEATSTSCSGKFIQKQGYLFKFSLKNNQEIKDQSTVFTKKDTQV